MCLHCWLYVQYHTAACSAFWTPGDAVIVPARLWQESLQLAITLSMYLLPPQINSLIFSLKPPLWSECPCLTFQYMLPASHLLQDMIVVHMQASPTSAGCEEEGLVVCRGGHIGGQPGTHTFAPCRSLAQTGCCTLCTLQLLTATCNYLAWFRLTPFSQGEGRASPGIKSQNTVTAQYSTVSCSLLMHATASVVIGTSCSYVHAIVTTIQ